LRWLAGPSAEGGVERAVDLRYAKVLSEEISKEGIKKKNTPK